MCIRDSCYTAGRGDGFDAPRDGMKEAFIASINTTIDAGEAPAAVFDEMANGTATVSDAFRWLSVFPAKDPPQSPDGSLSSIPPIYEIVTRKGPPYACLLYTSRCV